MPRFALEALSREEADAAGRAVVTKGEWGGPMVRGEGDVDAVCGGCGVVLAKRLTGIDQLGGIILVCPGCGGFCDSTRAAPAKRKKPF